MKHELLVHADLPARIASPVALMRPARRPRAGTWRRLLAELKGM